MRPVKSSSAAASRPTSSAEPTDPGHVAAQASLHEQLAELGPLGDDADVGHERQLHAPADGRAVDRGDHRNVGREERAGRGGEPGFGPQALRQLLAGRFHDLP